MPSRQPNTCQGSSLSLSCSGRKEYFLSLVNSPRLPVVRQMKKAICNQSPGKARSRECHRPTVQESTHTEYQGSWYQDGCCSVKSPDRAGTIVHGSPFENEFIQ
jgi:hypothetical protein